MIRKLLSFKKRYNLGKSLSSGEERSGQELTNFIVEKFLNRILIFFDIKVLKF